MAIIITDSTRRLGDPDTCDGEVYSLEDGTAIKIPKVYFYDHEGNPNIFANISLEYHFGKKLFAAGISVPEPVALERVVLRREGWPWNMETAGYRMEEIEGFDIFSLEQGSKLRSEIFRKYQQEFNKAVLAGFYPMDAGVNNCIYDPKRKKVFLIDFIEWRVYPEFLRRRRESIMHRDAILSRTY